MIKFRNDYCCSICGSYLFTEKEVADSAYPEGKIVRENDYKNYIYQVGDDNFVCNNCMEQMKVAL